MSSSSMQWRCVDSYWEDPFPLFSFLNKKWVLIPVKEKSELCIQS
uniref:Uncharacterized protein n=1 Tax=Arundo donax TaxID=35708 RepID=A0A0A9FVH6_ARUDO